MMAFSVLLIFALQLLNQLNKSIACVQNDTRLVGGKRRFEGRVEVCDNKEWKTVCNRHWGDKEAKVVCRQLGFPEDMNTTRVRNATSRFGSANAIQGIISVRWRCSGSEQQLLDCDKDEISCDHLMDAGVYCFGRRLSNCKEGEIRLIGEDEFSGRVQICVDDFWGTVCDDGWDLNDATTVCKQLGLSGRGIPTRRAYFGEGSGPILLSRAQCGSRDTSLINCTIDKTGINGCDHSEDAGVICKGYDSCEFEDWSVRLVGGKNEREGRVEVSYNGVWGTVCDNGWDEVDARVVCTQLGFYGQPIIFPPRQFGAGEGPILLYNVTCNTESHSNLSQCVHPLSIGIHNCDEDNTAGVICPKPPNNTSTLDTSISPILCTTALTTVNNNEHEMINTTAPVILMSNRNPTQSQSALFGSVGAALALGVIAVVGLVFITVVVLKRKIHNKHVTNKVAIDNPVYDENISFGPPTTESDSERNFQNPLYSDISPRTTNTTNKSAQNDTANEDEDYSEAEMITETETTYEIPFNSIPEVVYDMPPTLDSVTAAESNEECSYSVLGPTYSDRSHLQQHMQLPTNDESDYSHLQHK